METEQMALDQAIAWNVEQGLESKRVGLADTLAIVAGIMVALGGPFFLLKIKEYDTSGGILVLGVIGFSLSVLSLVMAVPVDCVNMKASALNPHYYFLLGEGGGLTGSNPAVARSDEDVVALDRGFQVTKADFMRIEKRHSNLVRLDKRLLAFQVAIFLGGLFAISADILWLLIVY